MTRCLNCGAERSQDLCDDCGLTSPEAEFAFRRRLLNLTAIFLLGAIASLAAALSYPPLELDGILIFMGMLFFFTVGLAAWLDFQARRHADIEAFKRLFRGLVPVPILLTGMLFANGKFDTSPPRSEVTTVLGKFTMPGTLHISRLTVVSWRAGHRLERVPVSADDYARFQIGDRVEVRIQSGLIGVPWVYGVYRK